MEWQIRKVDIGHDGLEEGMSVSPNQGTYHGRHSCTVGLRSLAELTAEAKTLHTYFPAVFCTVSETYISDFKKSLALSLTLSLFFFFA